MELYVRTIRRLIILFKV